MARLTLRFPLRGIGAGGCSRIPLCSFHGGRALHCPIRTHRNRNFTTAGVIFGIRYQLSLERGLRLWLRPRLRLRLRLWLWLWLRLWLRLRLRSRGCCQVLRKLAGSEWVGSGWKMLRDW